MRNSRFGIALALAVVPAAMAQAPAGPAPVSPTPTQAQAPSMIGSHQIDRYEAIRQLQSELKSDPNNKADWIILGELAHEVAFELPRDQDVAYYRISREAYERALQLDPNNPGLRAAVQFAKDQEAGAERFDQARRQGVSAYLAARRRELSQAGAGPTLRVYGSPAPATTTTTATTSPAAPVPAAPAPSYRPYAPAQGQPYTYQQYSTSSLPSVSTTAATMTPRVGQSNPSSTGGAVKPAAAAAPP